MTWNDKLKRLADGLASLGCPVHHYHRSRLEPPCIVWAEEGDNAQHADNGVAEQSTRGTLDYFTHEEFDPMVDTIQGKLQELEIAWGINSVQYEEDTDLIHYEWVWEV